jgi:uncharacterized membrane protein YedE/YeeE
MSSVATSWPEARARRIDWKPYAIGAGIGVLSWIVFVVVGDPLGITTALSQISGGAAAPILGAEAVAKNSYWATNALKLNYGVLFLAGTLIGGALSALLAGTWRVEKVPSVWAERFGASPMKRYVGAFIGGVIAMFGARLANGCTSGNGISGGLQLALSGWVFLAVMFATGILTAFIMFRTSRA